MRKCLSWLYNPWLVGIIVTIYCLLYIFIPWKHSIQLTTALPWLSSYLTPFYNWLYKLQIIMAWVLIIPFAALEGNKPIILAKTWNRLSSLVIPLSYPLLVLFAILGIMGITGSWWSWFSLGIMICFGMVIIILLRNKIGSGRAFIVALIAFFMAIALWEIPYQWILYFFYERYTSAIYTLSWSIMIQIPNLIACAIILWYYNHKYSIIRVNIATVITFLILVGTFVSWSLLGFWGETIPTIHGWVNNPTTSTSSIQAIIIKTSKISLSVLFTSVITSSKTVRQLFEK